MKAFYFRFLDDEQNPTGWIGFAMAKQIDDIFCIIDEFGDPYTVQIQMAKKAGFCVQWKQFTDGSGDAVLEMPPELSESMPWVFDDEAWIIPPWCLQ